MAKEAIQNVRRVFRCFLSPFPWLLIETSITVAFFYFNCFNVLSIRSQYKLSDVLCSFPPAGSNPSTWFRPSQLHSYANKPAGLANISGRDSTTCERSVVRLKWGSRSAVVKSQCV